MRFVLPPKLISEPELKEVCKLKITKVHFSVDKVQRYLNRRVLAQEQTNSFSKQQ